MSGAGDRRDDVKSSGQLDGDQHPTSERLAHTTKYLVYVAIEWDVQYWSQPCRTGLPPWCARPRVSSRNRVRDALSNVWALQSGANRRSRTSSSVAPPRTLRSGSRGTRGCTPYRGDLQKLNSILLIYTPPQSRQTCPERGCMGGGDCPIAAPSAWAGVVMPRHHTTAADAGCNPTCPDAASPIGQ